MRSSRTVRIFEKVVGLRLLQPDHLHSISSPHGSSADCSSAPECRGENPGSRHLLSSRPARCSRPAQRPEQETAFLRDCLLSRAQSRSFVLRGSHSLPPTRHTWAQRSTRRSHTCAQQRYLALCPRLVELTLGLCENDRGTLRLRISLRGVDKHLSCQSTGSTVPASYVRHFAEKPAECAGYADRRNRTLVWPLHLTPPELR